MCCLLDYNISCRLSRSIVIRLTFNENVEEKDTSMTERWLKGAGISPVSALLYSTLGDMLWISYL